MKQNSVLIIFDGVCNFCNYWVDFLIKRDRQKVFLFTANQNPKGQEVLTKYGEKTTEVGTVYVLDDNKLYKESSAVLRIAKHLPGLWPVLYVFILVPRPIRDVIYRWIANHRYQWFGQKSTCRIPTEEERSRFC